MSRAATGFVWAFCCLTPDAVFAQMTFDVRDINPNQSTLDATNPNGASGGRVNGLGVSRATPARIFAASEWGGLFRSTDNGLTWAHLPGHVPVATWDVEVDPANSNRVYATSFYDGRAVSRSGINVSTDGGNTWTRPATATPPANFCFIPAFPAGLPDTRRDEPSAFGISIDPANANRVFIGTNCGLAFSTNAGATWAFVDPTPADGANTIWDVVVHDGGIIDVCGDQGHFRSTDGGTTWNTGATNQLQGGRCSLAVSPDEAYVLFAVVGTTIFESLDGLNWPNTYANRDVTPANPNGGGRIPFVATNQRQGATYDLWFGDVNLYRGTCTTPATPAPGGAQRCTAGGTWPDSDAGGHNDVGDLSFVQNVNVDACPRLFSSDGGVYRNTNTTSPGCHNNPAWEQPNVTPHALWNYSFTGVGRAGVPGEDLYFGNQDTGTFGTLDAGAANVTWRNEQCCDGFAIGAEGGRALTTVCCCGGPTCTRATRMYISNAGLPNPPAPVEIANASYPPGALNTWEHLPSLANFGVDDYVVLTAQGVFVTLNVGAATIAWTQLGAASTPAAVCGVQVAFEAGTPTFFVKDGGCNGDQQGNLWRYEGTAAGGTWQQVPAPAGGGGFGIYAVDRNDPERIIASHLGGPAGPRVVMTWNGGTVWSALPALDTLMTGNGTFRYANAQGPTVFTGFNGYPQPTLLAFDRTDPDLVVAGGADSGVFLSSNGGTRWQLVTDPIAPATSNTPHIPRPYYAHFDHDPPGDAVNLFLGTRGRGAWRVSFTKVAMPELQVPSPPTFPTSCVGSKNPGTLNVCNTSPGDLVVTSITSSNPQFTIVPPSAGFPVRISHDFCFPFQVMFTPTSPGPKTATLTIASNDPNFPSVQVTVTANVAQPTVVTALADTGDFGAYCIKSGKFRELDLTINNSGACPLTVTNLSSSSPEFEMAQVMTFPLSVAPGDSIAVPIRFNPTSPGPKTATLTITSNDPTSPKTVTMKGTVPPGYVCEAPIFTSIDAAVGPTFGSGRKVHSGTYTFNGGGHVLVPFGPNDTFGVQAQGEYMFYPRRQEGQLDAGLLYRRGLVQFAVSSSFKTANLRPEAWSGALSHATLSFDFLLPAVRFSIFGSKGLRERDVVMLRETVGPATPSGQPVSATEGLIRIVDQLGGTVQFEVATDTWIDGNLVYLKRHAPGVGSTAGGAVRFTRLLIPNVAFTATLDVNESFLVGNTIGAVTFGVTLGRWSRPADYSNPVNPLGSAIPRVHYERFDRIR
jgi:hypothetical protein